jgi:hypothetical protein
MQRRLALLVGLDREQRTEERAFDIAEHVIAEHLAEIVRVRRRLELRDERRRIAVGHLVRRQERSLGLLEQARRAAVAIESARRRAFAVEEECEVVEIAQRRHAARSRSLEIRTAELHRQRVRLRVSVCGVVAARARHLARRGQRGVEENPAAERLRVRRVGDACRREACQHEAGGAERDAPHEVT